MKILSLKTARINKKILNFGLNFNLKTFSMHVDLNDDKFFEKIKDWWDPNGSMYTLHYYNDLRIKYLKRELFREGIIEGKMIDNMAYPFKNLKFLDVGCGGGLLCESLARLGAEVVGVDSNSNSFEVASAHLDNYEGTELKYMKSKLTYFLGSIDSYSSQYINGNNNKFDIITAMEVIEHVNSPKHFIDDLSSFIKPGGFIIFSTLNKTYLSYLTAIILGEKLSGIIPDGTHDWNKFIKPKDLIDILNNKGFSLINLTGVCYNSFTHKMNFVDDTSVNYMLIARKL